MKKVGYCLGGYEQMLEKVFIIEHQFQLQTHVAKRLFLRESIPAFYECDRSNKTIPKFCKCQCNL
jgi:hypothetical protein